MNKLFEDDADLQKKIGECRVQTINVQENVKHESGTARKILSRFIDPFSDDEIATITAYEKSDGTKYSVISRLRIGNTVYELEIP